MEKHEFRSSIKNLPIYKRPTLHCSIPPQGTRKPLEGMNSKAPSGCGNKSALRKSCGPHEWPAAGFF